MKTTFNTFRFPLLAFIFALGLGISSCSSSSEDMDEMTGGDSMDMKDGDNEDDAVDAPNFSLTSVDGQTVSLGDFEGKVLVMFFFGNTCPSCKAAAPSVQSKLADPYKSNESYAIIGLDQWNGNKTSVQGFKSSTGVDFPLLLNASGVASSYKTTYDRLIVVDKEGKIRFKGTKTASNDIDAAKAIVDEYLN